MQERIDVLIIVKVTIYHYLCSNVEKEIIPRPHLGRRNRRRVATGRCPIPARQSRRTEAGALLYSHRTHHGAGYRFRGSQER